MEQPKLNFRHVYHRGKNNILIVICNGYGADLSHPSLKKFMKELTKKGYSSVCFDYSHVSVIQMVKDTEKVIRYFSHYKKIYLNGFSLGTIPVIITSIINPKVTALITINGFFGQGNISIADRLTYFSYLLMTLFSRKHRKDYKFFKENFIPEKVKIPALIIYTKADKVVSPSQSVDFFKHLKMKNKKLVELPLLKHNLIGIGDVEKVVEEISRFEPRVRIELTV